MSDEMMVTYGAFAAVNKNLKTGKDASGKSIDPIRQRCFPAGLPYQKIYISSASDVTTKFYSLYREFAKKQIMGNPDFCVLHMDCELAFKPTLRGEIVQPLLKKEDVSVEMRNNPEKARREFFCIFSSDIGDQACFKRGVITRNEVVRKPELFNATGNDKYIIAFDPARSRDNSAILVLKVVNKKLSNGQVEKCGEVVNCINLMDMGKKIRSNMQTPDQIEYLKQLILDYNAGADGYGNIIGIYIDGGSGGGGVSVGDWLMKSWKSKDGTVHRGLIDKEYSSEYVNKFPDAVDKVRIIQPSKYKSIMFEETIELLNQDKISFTASYDNKGYLTIFDTDEEELSKAKQRIARKLKKKKLEKEEYDRQFNEELSKEDCVKTKTIKLDWQEEMALVNIDALKEEMVAIARKENKTTGKDSFDLAPEKANKLNDDRMYCLALACHALAELRRKDRLNVPKPSTDNLMDQLIIRPAKYK